ncbi:MAG: beta-mannosidase [Alloprevotella sp.]|nr:beta-mannosidase [Alloprevotella sp.]
MRKFVLYVLLLLPSLCLAATGFVKTDGARFVRDGKPYYFIGTNYWYAPILASQGQGGNRPRLKRELDELSRLGVKNLRILVGAERGSANVTSLSPLLQPEPGVLNDTLLDGLDYLLREMERRDMVGVFYLTNSWDWSGGYGFYLRECGKGDSPDASGAGWEAYCHYAAQFYTEPHAQNLYQEYVRRIVSRTNRYTGRAYRDEPAIMAWQLCNEPRPFAPEASAPMLRWAAGTARLIKSIDPNHLVSTGSEGTVGCMWDETLCKELHACPDIDYMTVHIWPLNWGWASRDALTESLPAVYEKAGSYLETNLRIARAIGKPVVVEEFGYSRDANQYLPGTPTLCRDAFYRFLFDKVVASRQTGDVLAGCNFWGWGGEGRPSAERWKPGDDYLSDPPHEPQGWYCVYNADKTTVRLIRNTAKALRK